MFSRNRNFPISNNEIFWINEIQLCLDDSFPFTPEALTRSYISISVDDRIKGKFPFAECLTFSIQNQQDNAATDLSRAFTTKINRKRLLQFPILINSSSNVVVKLEMSSNSATQMNNKNIRVYLKGIKFDKIEPFVYDPRKSNNIERLNFTFYDTLSFNTSGGSFDLFSTQNKNVFDFSKIFPLGDKEVFSIENIELFFNSNSVNVGTSTNDYTILKQLRQSLLKIIIDDIEFINFSNDDFVTLFLFNTSSTLSNMRYFSNKGYTLPTPISIPSQSRVKITLDIPAITYLSNSDYFTVMLKGTLQRIVA